MTQPPAVNPWDAEYLRQGIPSSHRESPSGAVQWLLAVRPLLTETPLLRALDVGCGTGRNTRALAATGAQVVGVDASAVAIEKAQAPTNPQTVTFLHRDIAAGLPAEDASCEVVIDTFVSFHLTDPAVRLAYYTDLARVVRTGGVLLVSLATDADGFYAACPRVGESAIGESPAIPVVRDEVAGVDNLLPTEATHQAEVAHHTGFELAMTRRKRTRNLMHGTEYDRFTLATVWQRPG